MCFKYPQIAKEVESSLESLYGLPVRWAVIKVVSYPDYLKEVRYQYKWYNEDMIRCGCTREDYVRIVDELRDWVWVKMTNLGRKGAGIVD